VADSSTQAAVQEIIRYQFARNQLTKATDHLSVEEPLEIIIDFHQKNSASAQRMTLSVTMRSPGHDEELATGFLFSEGLIRNKIDIQKLLRDNEAVRPDNSMVVTLAQPFDGESDRLQRHFFTNSSCGVCGKTSMQALEMLHQPSLTVAEPIVSAGTLCQLPLRLREHQQQFANTGGIHAAALFSPAGELLLLQEDVGRHNAMDKLIGACVLEDRLPLLKQSLILVSGRSSFELVQKALMADVPILAAIGAPTSLAVQLAARHDLTLVGFLKADSFNIYHSPERVI
jgi:FdhD protein